jgi:hypothetical protein
MATEVDRKIKIHKGVLNDLSRYHISYDRFIRALTEVQRVAKLGCPQADWRVEPIKCTMGEWHRLKNDELRIILKFGSLTIELLAVLRRSDDTYIEIKKLWETDKR